MRLVALGLSVLLLTVACGQQPEPESGKTALTTISGTVTYRERMMLRPDMVINVRLNDISLMDVPARVIDEQVISAKGERIPVAWSLEYDAEAVNDSMSLAVRAEIRDGEGKLVWTTTTVHPVITRGSPTDNVEIMLEAVAR